MISIPAGVTSELTLDDLRNISMRLRQNTLPNHKVLDPEEARKMTLTDPCGRIWRVGEEYYLVPVA